MPFLLHRSKSFRTSAYRFHSCSSWEADRWEEWQGDFCGHCSLRWEAWGCNCSHEQHLPAHQIQRGFPHCYFEWYCGSLEVMIFSLDTHNTVNFCISERRASCLSLELHSSDSQSHLLLLMAAFWHKKLWESHHSSWSGFMDGKETSFPVGLYPTSEVGVCWWKGCKRYFYISSKQFKCWQPHFSIFVDCSLILLL